jgi:hypothetical protein
LEWNLLQERLSFGSAQNPTGGNLTIMSLRNNSITHVVSDPFAIANTTTVFMSVYLVPSPIRICINLIQISATR